METLITIALLLLLTAVSNWLQKRGQRNAEDTLPESDQASPPSPGTEPKPRSVPPSTPSPPPQKSTGWDWAGELRRILEEASRDAPAPTPHPTPEMPRPRPPVPMPAVPRPMAEPPARPVAPKPLHSLPAAVIHPMVEPEILTASKQAYASASRLSSQVQEHLRQSTEYKGSASAARGRPQISTEVDAALALLRNPSSARQAIIVSTVLGPPKALQER
jgi:hypothetical protein